MRGHLDVLSQAMPSRRQADQWTIAHEGRTALERRGKLRAACSLYIGARIAWRMLAGAVAVTAARGGESMALSDPAAIVFQQLPHLAGLADVIAVVDLQAVSIEVEAWLREPSTVEASQREIRDVILEPWMVDLHEDLRVLAQLAEQALGGRAPVVRQRSQGERIEVAHFGSPGGDLRAGHRVDACAQGADQIVVGDRRQANALGREILGIDPAALVGIHTALRVHVQVSASIAPQAHLMLDPKLALDASERRECQLFFGDGPFGASRDECAIAAGGNAQRQALRRYHSKEVAVDAQTHTFAPCGWRQAHARHNGRSAFIHRLQEEHAFAAFHRGAAGGAMQDTQSKQHRG